MSSRSRLRCCRAVGLLLALTACAQAPTNAPAPPPPQPRPLAEVLRSQHRRLYQAAQGRQVYTLLTATEQEALPVSPDLVAEVERLDDWSQVMARLSEALDMDVMIEESHFLAVLTPRQRLTVCFEHVPLHEAALVLGLAAGKPVRVDPAVPDVPVSLRAEGGWRELFAALLDQVGAGVFGMRDDIRALWLAPLPFPDDQQWAPLEPNPDRALRKASVEAVDADGLRLSDLESTVTLTPGVPTPPPAHWGAFRLVRDATDASWRLAGWAVKPAAD